MEVGMKAVTVAVPVPVPSLFCLGDLNGKGLKQRLGD